MTYAIELGRELRRRRVEQGLTLAAPAAKMPGSPDGPTLGTWEHPKRDMPMSRLVDVCTALGARPQNITAQADARAVGYSVPMVGLAALIRTRRPELGIARRWAQVCDDQGAPNVIHLPGYATSPPAVLSGFPAADLAAALSSVTVTKAAGGPA